MDNKSSSFNFCISIIVILLFVAIFISLFAWITYGTLEGVLGSLAYGIVGLLCTFPWLIPFAGIPLGILDMLGIYGFNMYNLTLNIAHLNSSWMSFTWYWVVSIFGVFINLILIYLIISWLKRLKYRKRQTKINLALINCSIIDGNRDSKVIDNGVILIKNIGEKGEKIGIITAVGSINDVKVPERYKQVDLKGAYVLPGLINAHCHLTGSGKPTRLMKLSDETMEKLMKFLGTPLGKLILLNMMKKNAFTALNAGITTLRSMGDPHYIDLKLRDKINKGKILGPNLICAGKGICITGGHGSAMTFIADSIPEIRKAIRKNLRKRVDFIKVLSTGGVMDARKVGEAGRPQMTVEEIETACFEAHRGGLLVATHCESTEGIKEALLGGVDSIEHGAEITDDLVPLFKDNPKSLRGYTVVTPTITAGMGLATLPIEDTKIMPESFENAKIVERGMIYALQKAYIEGINISCGTDASVPYSTQYDLWKELKYYLKYTKMTPQVAIYYVTKGNAKNIGIDNFTGSIETGKSADLIVIPGNPLENINFLGEVMMVMIRGHLISRPKVKKIKKLKELTPIEI
ncbi:MAG: amidohydrolase family protein [Candidatus Hermodarchaeota archaeon]